MRASRRASPAAQALRSDVLRRAASRGGTLRCAEARRVAYRDVDKSYASHRPPQYGAVASRLQDSAAAINRAPSVYDVRRLSDVHAGPGRACSRSQCPASSAIRVTSEMGPFSDLGARNRDVRFSPMSRHRQVDLPRPKRANSGLMHRSKKASLLDHLVGAGE